MTSWAARQRAADVTWRHDRMVAEQVSCPEPGCEVSAGETCRNLRTGAPLEHQAAHGRRIDAGRAAEAVEGVGDDEARRPTT